MSLMESRSQLDDQWFKEESLRCLRKSLKERTYPGYPTRAERIYGSLGSLAAREPLHPWIDEMLADPDIGAVEGKGAYWNWGPNYTADPIVIRRDLGEPHVLVIKRKDTGTWALPGGFIDGNESEVAAAVREAHEETGIDLTGLAPNVVITYRGPVADLRTTAHAWPETTAVSFEIPDTAARQFTNMLWEGRDDAQRAAWKSVEQIHDHLFGSHKLLLTLALKNGILAGE